MKVAFFKGGTTLFERLIRWWTRSPYAHVELLFNDGMMVSAFPGVGVRALTVASIDPKQWDTIDIPLDFDNEVSLRAWCQSELGCGYDWWGLFLSQVLELPRSHASKWFCSEFCTAALEHIDLLLGTTPCMISPGQLYELLRNHPTRSLACAP